MDDLIAEFLTETAEGLAELDLELVRLERNPNDPQLIGSIFRIVHTIKGTCGFLGLPRLETLAHAAENVLGKFRDRELEVTPPAVTLILHTLDRIKTILAGIEQTESEPPGDDAALIAELDAAAEGRLAAAAAPAAKPAADASLFDRVGGMPVLEAAMAGLYERVLRDPMLQPFFAHTTVEVQRAMMRDFLAMSFGGPDEYVGHDMKKAHGHLGDKIGPAHFDAFMSHMADAFDDAGIARAAADEALAIVGRFRGDIAPAKKAAAPAPAAAASAPAAPVKAPDEAEHVDGGREIAAAAQSIRVGVGLLETLMTTVSELVLVRNQLLQMVRAQENSTFAAPLQRLNHITSELQEGVMKTRMQPIGNAWAKLPRLVRDIAQETGKKIELEMIGSDTELDRQVLELIKDPLTHMVRNSGDHGIELPQDRVMVGKAETGKITLRAFHEGGQIVIRLADDGRGIPVSKIRAKAAKLGLASDAELEGLADQQVLQFIFKPGFSTAEQITSISGRGVGMDVVKTNIEKIGGAVDLQTVEGRGTTFTIKIPLTLAIVSALILECGGERFAIPQIAVSELVRASKTSEHRIETVGGTAVLRLRNRLLPLVVLRERLGLGSLSVGDMTEAFVVVAQVGTYSFGIVVDRVFDTEEIVVKPVAPVLRECGVYSGNTILGDGSVVMILDPNGLAGAGEMQLGDDAVVATHAMSEERVPLLLFRGGTESPKAVPLALVARLEEIDVASVERSDGRAVVQYRGSLMPLLPVDPGLQMPASGRMPVVVFTDRNRSMGLIVGEILDIVDANLNVELSSGSEGMLGTAVVAGKATEIIDTTHYLTRAFSDWWGTAQRRAANDAGDGRRVLVVDDSAFFRNLLAPLLSTAGYEVTAVDSAAKALRLEEAGREFDVIVSDIEMPEMDGFAFAQAVRSAPRWRDVPIVALSSRTGTRDLERGRDAGFVDYVPKFDREGLLATLSSTLAMTTASDITRGAA